MSNTIWCTVECDAWSRAFDYQNYLSLHRRSGTTSKAVTEQMYYTLCTAFESEMVRSFESRK
jgi:hypothetical protein